MAFLRALRTMGLSSALSTRFDTAQKWILRCPSASIHSHRHAERSGALSTAASDRCRSPQPNRAVRCLSLNRELATRLSRLACGPAMTGLGHLRPIWIPRTATSGGRPAALQV